jgi:TonB family protein
VELTLNNQYRELGERKLPKVLILSLCCSALLHTAAFAAVNYLAQDDLKDMEITTIERVELDPEPKPTPSPVALKPIPTVKPQVVKITKALPQTEPEPEPQQKEVKISEPEPAPVPIPTPVVKITESKVAIQQPFKPIEPEPAPIAPKIANPTIEQPQAQLPKPQPIPAAPKVPTPIPFPDPVMPEPQVQSPAPKLVLPKQPKIAARQPTPAKTNQTALAAKPQKSTVVPKLEPEPNPEPTENIAAAQPATPRLDTAPAPVPTATNQTNLSKATKSPANWGEFTPDRDRSPIEDDFASTPGNNKRIATNTNPALPSSDNQTGLAGDRTKKRGVNSAFTGGIEDIANTDDISASTPGNNKRVATNTNPALPSSDNQTGLAGDRTKKRGVNSDFNSGVEDITSIDDISASTPGNNKRIATNTNPALPSSDNQTGLAGDHTKKRGVNSDFTGGIEDIANTDDISASTPGNNKRIATNTNPALPSSDNQTGLAGDRASKRGVNSAFTGGIEDIANTDDISASTPGNNKRVATNTNPAPASSSANSTGLRGKGRRNGSIAKNFGVGDGVAVGDGIDELGSGTPGNVATGSNRQLSIQCLQNCEIRYPENLQDNDTGKDKILVKVSINANGKVTNAVIARSSGNSNLDRVTVAGIEKMQLTPMGKPMTFKVKVSTLTDR